MIRGLITSILAASCVLAAACSRNADVAKRKYVERGDRYFAQKKYREAMIEYFNATKQDPRFGEAHFKLAESFDRVGDIKQAFPEYLRAADLLPDNTDAQIKAGRLLVNGGYFKEATARARAVLTRDRNNLDALLLLGNALAGLKNYADAANVAAQAIKVDPERAGVYATLAVFQLAGGNRDLAEAAFIKATKMAPQSADAHLNLGNFYRATGRLADAEHSLKRAYELQPDWARVNQALAALYVQWNRPTQAEPYFKAVVGITKDSKARFELADYYTEVGRLDDARKTLEELATDPPSYAEAKTRIALIEYAAGRREEAHRIIDEVLKSQPRNAAALTTLARLLLAENQPAAALDRAKQATLLDQRSADAQLVTARIQLALNNLDEAQKAFSETLKLEPHSLAAELELSELHRTRNEIETSIEYAQQAVSEHLDSVPARIALIRALMVRDDDYPRAEKELMTLLTRHPESAEAHSLMGAIWLLKKNSAAARQSFERARQLSPTSAEATTGLVVLDLSDKKPAAARAQIETFVSKSRNTPGSFLIAAKLYALLNDEPRVEEALKGALKADPSNPELYERLGRIYTSQRRLKEATQQFSEIVRIDPHSIPATTMLGWLAYAQKDFAEAQQWWEKTIQIDPRSAAAANNLAWIYAQQNTNLDAALTLAQTAKAAYPTLPQVNDTLGLIYYREELDAQAIYYIQQAIDGEPSNPVYYYHLGLAYAQKGEDASARRNLEHALQINKNFEGAADARRVLGTLIF